jgi:hypothetical protein
MLSSFRWIKDGFIPKSNANLVMNITCVLLYLSIAILEFKGEQIKNFDEKEIEKK